MNKQIKINKKKRIKKKRKRKKGGKQASKAALNKSVRS
jgi:hypothetical protein